jgi:hypothetical protein
MKSFKRSFSVFFGVLAFATLLGCVTDDEPKGSEEETPSEEIPSKEVSYDLTMDVVEITAPGAGVPGSLVTRSLEYYCEDGVAGIDTLEEEQFFHIAGGSLFLWAEGDCLATKLSGSSSSVVGTWTTNSLAITDSVPAAFRPADPEDCNEYGQEPGDTEILEDGSVSYVISETQVKAKITGEFCFARTFAASLALESSEDYAIVSDECTVVKVRNLEASKTATFTSTFKDQKVSLRVSYNGDVCRFSLPLSLGDEPPVCSEDSGSEAEYEAFGECLYESGFLGAFEMEKAGALLKNFRLP